MTGQVKLSFWKDHGGTIAMCVAFVCIIGTIFYLAASAADKPIAQKSTAWGNIVSVELKDGTKLKPGDKGFDEAVKEATVEWVP